jgi:hypothetical protein
MGQHIQRFGVVEHAPHELERLMDVFILAGSI